MTVSRYDIEQHAIRPCIDEHYDEDTCEAICDAILEAAPRSTWTYSDLRYNSPLMDGDTFWAIVERVAAGA